MEAEEEGIGMTEGEWNACTNPREMLASLRHAASDRKLRLAAIACTRRLQHRVFFVRAFRHALDLAERDADGLASHEEMATARATVKAVGGPFGLLADWAVSDSCSAFDAAWACACGAENEKEEVCDLLRDIFHNPHRPAAFDSAWLLWNDSVIPRLAKPIYDQRAFDRLPILADALEEVGCTDQDFLDHCRRPAEHVRGCWVVDALLGKT
jgi:hypothetical protein